jgi:hypothetical protein
MFNCCYPKNILENVISPVSTNSTELRELKEVSSKEMKKSDPGQPPLSFSLYVNTSDKNPIDQVKDLMKDFILNNNTRIILAFASFNINDSNTIPGLDNMSIDDIYNIIKLVKSTNAKIILSIGGKYYFNNSDLYNYPTQLANNINGLVQKFNFDGVDFDFGDTSPVFGSFTQNAISLINTLRSINNNLHITLTTAAQAWSPDNYEKDLILSTIDSINAWQVMEHDLYISQSDVYLSQIMFDMNYYKNAPWSINPNKTIVVIKPGIDNTGIDDNKHNLSLSDATSVAQFAKNNKYQGICLWTSYIDSKGCDGNVPNKYSTDIKTLLESYAPGPYPSPPDVPTSPIFTADEITKIQSNLDVIMDFNTACFNEQGQVINEVFTKLQGSQFSPPKDTGNSIWLEIVQTGLEILAVALANPIFDVVVILFNSLVSYTSENADKLAGYLDVNLNDDASDLFGRNLNSYNANQIYLGYMHKYPNVYKDQQFTYNDKVYTLRDLISITLPQKDDPNFNKVVEIQCRAFRQKITIPEMIKMQFWDIYFVQDNNNPIVYYGESYRPSEITKMNGAQRSRPFDQNNVGNGVRIFANDEVWYAQPSYEHISAFGNSNDDLKGSYLNAINLFIHGIPSQSVDGFPASFVHPWTVTDKSVYSFRWYIFEGYEKIPSGIKNYTIANGEFIKWLFIDDGAGNITNENGVIYRADILSTGIFSYGNYIPKENILPSNESVIFKSTDYEYMYPGCPDTVKSNKIYLSNIYNKSKK